MEFDDRTPKTPGWQITFALVAAPVTHVQDPMWVIIPDFDTTKRWGPCRWQVRFEYELVDVAEDDEGDHNVPIPKFIWPKRGDFALVVFDNYRHPWVPIYWPYGYFPV